MKEGNLWFPKKAMIGAFILCFIIAGIPFWQTPYAQLAVPNAFFGIGAIAVFSVAAVLAFRFSFRQGLIIPGLVFPAVLMIRVIVEGLVEPGRHNLWPLALIIAIVAGMLVACAGAVCGWLAGRLFR